ncbi:trafficking regulator of GLUT4 (SLC2A4) 1b [Carassius auratus]|uniref:Trafficking regulator of GLUT4 (SLC2A4) 1b n=1 Tax=Carassius auratus TaxID=7957 RepID=A0A6P6ITR0_CARAU|nr:tumor suppressor candidate 5 homolog [Carassius auratus]XP_052443280.1 trafficking regulator of GLUT4 1-like [Carassius gibelio]
MAVNTDAPHATGALGERAALHSTDFGDTQKLLDTSDKELKKELNHSPSDTHLVKCFEAEQTVVNVAPEPSSPSRVIFSRASSPTLAEREPCSFMWVAVISCFCPAVPINLFAIYFAHMSRSMIEAKDYDGARRLGRLSLLLSIVSIVVGLAIVLYLLLTEY